MSRHMVSDNLRRDVVALWRDKKLTYSEIAGLKGISRGSVAGIIDRWKGRDKKPTRAPGEKVELVIAEAKRDPARSPAEIARAAGVSRAHARNVLKEKGIKTLRVPANFHLTDENAKWVTLEALKAGARAEDVLNAILADARPDEEAPTA